MSFEQASESAPTTISWNITGHDPNAERGMHVHAFGDNTNGCTSAGPHCKLDITSHTDVLQALDVRGVHANHYDPIVNPQNKTHGAPSDSERHVGDLGNFKTDGQGNAQGSVDDKLVQLIGPQSVLGVRLKPPPNLQAIR